jgi:hypothetical protein
MKNFFVRLNVFVLVAFLFANTIFSADVVSSDAVSAQSGVETKPEENSALLNIKTTNSISAQAATNERYKKAENLAAQLVQQLQIKLQDVSSAQNQMQQIASQAPAQVAPTASAQVVAPQAAVTAVVEPAPQPTEASAPAPAEVK